MDYNRKQWALTEAAAAWKLVRALDHADPPLPVGATALLVLAAFDEEALEEQTSAWPEIGARLGLSGSTVAKTVARLEAEKLIVTTPALAIPDRGRGVHGNRQFVHVTSAGSEVLRRFAEHVDVLLSEELARRREHPRPKAPRAKRADQRPAEEGSDDVVF